MITEELVNKVLDDLHYKSDSSGIPQDFESLVFFCKSLWDEIRKDNIIREKLSELEHIQWEHWSKSLGVLLSDILEDLRQNNINDAQHKIVEKLNSWEKDWIPYSELSEKIKDYDRIWADKVLEKLKN